MEHNVPLMDEVVCETVLDQAYAWLCTRRRAFPPDADVWAFRRHWQRERPRLRAELLAGTYRLAVLSRVTLQSGEEIDLWSARDALVLKAVTVVLAQRLPLSPRCAHLKGHGGSKGALREVLRHLDANRFVLRTDIRHYYASIAHDLVLDQLAGCIQDGRVLNLVAQYLTRTVERGGLFWDYHTGIALGCPLSPLLGAFALGDLDQAFERLGLFYVRFMDDVLVLAPTRGKLRRAVQLLNRTLAGLHLEKHPAKTFIGRSDRGFDFLGYHLAPGRLALAQKTIETFVERAHQLYEHEPDGGAVRLGVYVRRWAAWAGGAPAPGTHLWLVQRGLRYRRLARGASAARRLRMIRGSGAR